MDPEDAALKDATVQFFEGDEPTDPSKPVPMVATVTGKEAVKLIRFGFIRDGGRWDYSNDQQRDYRARTGNELKSRQRINPVGGLVPLRRGEAIIGWNVYTKPA